MQRRWQRTPEGVIVRAPDPEPEPDAASGGDGSPPSGVPGVRRRASAGLALRLGFRDTYDYLGTALLMSLLWSALGALGALGGQAVGMALARAMPGQIPLLVSIAAALVGYAVTTGPLLAGFARFGRHAASRQEPELFDLAWGYRHAFGRSVRLALAQVVGGAVLAANGGFYLALGSMPMLVVGTVFLYSFGFWSVACLYQWPLLVEQDLAAGAAIRKSALLVLDNLGYSLLVGLVCLALTALLWVTILPGVLLWAGAFTMLQTQSTRELLRKYALLPPDPTLDPVAEEMER